MASSEEPRRPRGKLRMAAQSAAPQPTAPRSPTCRPTAVPFRPLRRGVSADSVQPGTAKGSTGRRWSPSPVRRPPPAATTSRSAKSAVGLKRATSASSGDRLRGASHTRAVQATSSDGTASLAVANESTCGVPSDGGPPTAALGGHVHPSEAEPGAAGLHEQHPDSAGGKLHSLADDAAQQNKLSTAVKSQQRSPSQPIGKIPGIFNTIGKLAELEEKLRDQVEKRRAVERRREELMKVLHNATARTAELEKLVADKASTLDALRLERTHAQMDKEATKRRRVRASRATKKLEEEMMDARIALGKRKDELCSVIDQRRAVLKKALAQKFMQGRIRVVVRVRPSNSSDGKPQNEAVSCTDARTVAVERRDTKGRTKCSFAVDKAFPPAASQGDIYRELVLLVKSALDGGEACVFAYGQTGAGKTHTFEGPAAAAGVEERGIIARALEGLWASSQKPHCSYEVTVSVVEILNDDVYDVLVDHADGESRTRRKLKLGEEDGAVVVRDLTKHKITSSSQIDEIVQQVKQNRSTAATAMNERSSRSHVIYFVGVNGDQCEERIKGRLSLVDLAASEQVSHSGDDEERRREASSIKTSLLALEAVFIELSSGRGVQFVPFRRCKLTHVLRDSLTDKSNVLVMVNLSARAEDVCETMNSLRFACTVKQRPLENENEDKRG